MIRKLVTSGAALLAFALAAPAAGQPAQSAYPPQPELGQPRPFTLPRAETFTLANGLEVTFIPFGIAPKAVVSLRVEAGNQEDAAQTWISDLTVAMMREGAGGRTGTQIAEAAASMGGQLGTNVSLLDTSISLNVLSEHAGDAARLIAAVATRPDFPASEFTRVRQDLLRGLAVARSQPQPIADAVLARAVYGDHPYGRVLPTAAQLGAYTLEDVRRFHAANFGARRARLYVAGRFDAAAVRRAIEEAFGGWAAGSERPSVPATQRPGPQLLLVDRPGAPQSTIRIAFPAPAVADASDIRMRVMNALLGGAFTSRITQNIREAKGYTYSPGSAIEYQAGQAVWVFNADVTTNDTGAALREVIGEMRRLQTEAPPVEESRGIANWLAGTFILQNASSSAVVNSLATRDLHGLPADWLERYVPGVLAVDSAQIQAMAAQQLPLDRMTIVVVGDLNTVRPQLEALEDLRSIRPVVADPI